MLTLHETSAAEAPIISRIYASSWRASYPGVLREDYLRRLPDDSWTTSIRSWLDSGQLYGVTAELDGTPVGCVIYGRGRNDGWGDWGEIVALYVLPEVMRQGVGSALLKEALRLLRADGYERCYLWAIEKAPAAHGFYTRHGFMRTDECVPYRLGGDDVTDVRYVLER